MVDDDPLALAQRRIWDAQKIVAEQKRRIAGLRAVGASTLDAVQALSAFESNLRCSRNIATPCYRLRGVGNKRSAGIVLLRPTGRAYEP